MRNSQEASPRAVHRISRPWTSLPKASLHHPEEYPAEKRQAQSVTSRPRDFSTSASKVLE